MTNAGNIGTQGMTWAVLGSEALGVLYDLRWMLMCVAVLIMTDFWWGSKEALKRFEETHDDKYRWRFSRAGRRSLNKCIDFLTYLLVGAALGMAIFEPLGICTHTVSGAVALGMGALFDISSITGHVCYLHGISTRGGLPKILWRILAAFVKRRNNDLGEAIEEVAEVNETEKVLTDRRQNGE